jgi:hypothetical protein
MDTNKNNLSGDDNKPTGILLPDNFDQTSFDRFDPSPLGDAFRADNSSHQIEKTKKIIDIKPSTSVTEINVIDSLNFLSDKNILRIKFNDIKYNNKTIIISTNLAHSDWNKFSNECRKSLEQKGIENGDIITILNSFDSNHEVILESRPNVITNSGNNKIDFKSISDLLLDVAKEKIDLIFVDQYQEAFVRIYVNDDHYEILSISSRKFSRLLSKFYFEKNNGQVINKEAINTVVDTLQAQAEFGKTKYPLSLRVAEYEGDFYYDLTDDIHRCIRISKKDSKWEVLDKTPVPLFRRYNQIPQQVFSEKECEKIKGEGPSKNFSPFKEKDPLDEFLSKMTNIKQDDEGTKLLIKATLVSYFIPNIPHPIVILHGSAGSAKSTFQLLLKNIIDPAKPSLLTLHNNSSEFVQQLAHNYLATYDNLKFTPYWLADEVCKAVTGVGQTKRLLYTDDEDKTYEYKHCLIFNGINVAFSEPDVLDRSIVIHLDEIADEKRRTEKEILHEFYSIRPFILRFIFDTLSKAIVIKDKVLTSTKKLPRMADFAIWGEAILQSWGYKEGKFLKIYYDSIGRQNDEVIDSNPIALAIRKLVEEFLTSHSDSSNTIFEGTPMELLDQLNRISEVHRINTYSKEWPKDVKWLIRRINMVKSNLHKALDVRISTSRDSRDNTSKIFLTKNISGDSGKHDLSPNSNNLTPYFDNLSPEKSCLTPKKNQDLNTESDNSGDTGHTGDISNTNSMDESSNKIIESENVFVDNSKTLNESQETGQHYQDPNILYDSKTKLFSCKQHPRVMNIHYDEIVRHRKLSASHHSDVDGNDNDSSRFIK